MICKGACNEMTGLRTIFPVFAVVAIMLTAGFVAAEDIDHDRDIQTEILTGTTDRLGGGDWVGVKAGDMVFAVVYGNDESPNWITILTEQKRYLGGADVYSSNDDLLRVQGIPVDLLFAQRLQSMIEFIDLDNDHLFDLRWVDEDGVGLPDRPVKAASLNTSWQLDSLTVIADESGSSIDFNLTAEDVPYTWVWPAGMVSAPRNGSEVDGVVERVTFTFHIDLVIVENNTVQMVPWYRVEMENGRVSDTEFLEYRNYTSDIVNGTIKYDHYIEGWDFESNETLLAVETHIIAGMHSWGKVTERLRERFTNMRCLSNETVVADEEGNGEMSPLLTRDALKFRNNWEQFGRVSWVSNVTVDNRTEQMMFQIQNGGPFMFMYGNQLFLGFQVRAAFIYPAGSVIFHDPQFASEANILDLPDTTNAFPNLMTILQLGIVGAAVAVAILLGIFMRNRDEKGSTESKSRPQYGFAREGLLERPEHKHPSPPIKEPWRKEE